MRQTDKHVSCKGIDFVNHIYVPQLDSATGAYFHDREDHAHLLKRIATSTRKGLADPDFDNTCFSDVLKDPQSGLSFSAPSGQDQQNVPDAGKLL